jgi:hypothetical protein
MSFCVLYGIASVMELDKGIERELAGEAMETGVWFLACPPKDVTILP